jgi:DNA-binding NarL/FixJ family response regulator
MHPDVLCAILVPVILSSDEKAPPTSHLWNAENFIDGSRAFWMGTMRIFLASADERLRLALLVFLDHEPGMGVVGMADRLEGLSILVGASRPEVVLLDYELARETTTGLICDLHHLEYSPRIIILSVNPEIKEAILEAGADGFVSKNVPPDELLPILRKMRPAEAKL